jgi:hypothetical protein
MSQPSKTNSEPKTRPQVTSKASKDSPKASKASSNTREPPNVVTPTKPAKLRRLAYTTTVESLTNVHASKSGICCSLCKEVFHVQSEEDIKDYIFLSCPICDLSFCKGCFDKGRVVTPFFCDLCFRRVCDDCAVNCEVCDKSTCNDSVYNCRDNHICE